MKSEKDAILLRQKHSNIANKHPHKDEQGYKQSYNEGRVAFKLTSKTTPIFFVLLSSRTEWCDCYWTSPVAETVSKTASIILESQ